MESTTIGLDIGGANIKLSDGYGLHRSLPFPLWKEPDGLEVPLFELMKSVPAFNSVRITMTGEIADGFHNKIDGVKKICSQCTGYFHKAFGIDKSQVLFYSQGDGWVQEEKAIDDHLSVAAANWHLSARFLAHWFYNHSAAPFSSFLFLDFGSTTLDLHWVDCDPKNIIAPKTDFQRIQSGNLIYQGMERTPIFGLLPNYQSSDRQIPLAQEIFATAKDAYLLCRLMNEDEEDVATADGRSFTTKLSKQRISRLLCSDFEEVPDELVDGICKEFVKKQSEIIISGIKQVLHQRPEDNDSPIVVCGAGQGIIRKILSHHFPTHAVLGMEEFFEAEILTVFPAFAAARSNW